MHEDIVLIKKQTFLIENLKFYKFYSVNNFHKWLVYHFIVCGYFGKRNKFGGEVIYNKFIDEVM